MVSAQKKYDDYEDYTEYENDLKQKSKARVVVVTKRNALRKFKAICAVLLVLLMSLVILYRYTLVNEYNQKIRALKIELSQLQKANSQLEIELEREVDLTQIEQLAVQRLGMQYPDKNQTVYLQVSKSDFTEIPEGVNDGSGSGSGVLGSATQIFSQLVSYLN